MTRKTITVRLTPTLENALSRHAGQEGLTITDVVTRALEAFLGLGTNSPPASSQMEELRGIVADLAQRVEPLEAIEQQLSALALRLEILEASNAQLSALAPLDSSDPLGQKIPTATLRTDTPGQCEHSPAPQPEGLAGAVTKDLSKGLTGAELAARLKMENPNTVNGEWKRKQANPPKFHQWSRERDPQGIAWERRGEQGKGGKYYPLSRIVPDSPE